MKITIAQISSSISKNNLENHISIINNNIETKTDLIIFPELSLNGYKMMDSVFENCYTIDELKIFSTLSANIDIVIGVALRENDRVYNSSIYFSDGDICHIHKKNNLPTYLMFEESRYFFAGKNIELFTANNRTNVMLICEDIWNPKTLYRVSKLAPESIFVLSNSPARDFNSNSLLIEQQWNALLQTLSIYTGAYTIFANRVGFEDGVGFWGGSKIISPKGEIIKSANKFEEEFLNCYLETKIANYQRYLLRSNI